MAFWLWSIQWNPPKMKIVGVPRELKMLIHPGVRPQLTNIYVAFRLQSVKTCIRITICVFIRYSRSLSWSNNIHAKEILWSRDKAWHHRWENKRTTCVVERCEASFLLHKASAYHLVWQGVINVFPQVWILPRCDYVFIDWYFRISQLAVCLFSIN